MTNLIDQKERISALDISCSHHVEAPAGSGKTLLLTMRFLKLLAEVNHPHEILALTFTDKAVGEMRNRIIDFLLMAKRKKVPQNDLEKMMLGLAENALKKHSHHIHSITSADGLHIMTFHGFCNYIARRAPLEAGIPPDYEILDNTRQSILVEKAVHRSLDELLSFPPDNIYRKSLGERLLHHNNKWNNIVEELKGIIRNRDQFSDLIRNIQSTYSENLSTLHSILNKRLRGYIEQKLASLHKIFSKHELNMRWSEFIEHLSIKKASAASSLPSQLPDYSWEELYLWQKIADILLTQSGTPRKTFGPKNGFYSNFKKTEWGKLISEMDECTTLPLHESRTYPSKDDMTGDMEALDDFILVAAAAIKEYEDMCRKEHVVDFIGLELAALRILNEQNPSDLHLYLDHQIKHILVDEFQDTNRNQWELVIKICSGWTPGEGRTIFIVGDPKQSIYAFRNAEVKLFLEAKNGIPVPGYGTVPLRSAQLKTNFRSTEKLIGWINSLFGKTVMAHPDYDADEVPFTPSSPIKYANENSEMTLNLFAYTDTEKARQNEALWLSKKVIEVLDKTKWKKSIGILLFTRNRIHNYLTALKENGIPVQVQDGLPLTKRPEIKHLIQMTRLIAYPHDDLAWASLLRSPWSWYNIKTLHETASQNPDSWIDKIRMTSGADPEMTILVNAVNHAFQRAGRDSLSAVVKRLWEELDGPRKTASLYGMAGVANCHNFFDILENVEHGIPQETVKQMNTLMDSLYEETDPTTSRSPVSMMTIHKAKGLEFDIVFLPFMDWNPLAGGSNAPPPYLLERIPGTKGNHIIAMSSDRRFGTPSAIYTLLNKFKKNRKWGEAKRLLYVATTRARQTLHMSGIAKLKDDNVSASNQSVLKWVMEHEEINGISPKSIESRSKRTLSIAVNPEINSVTTSAGKIDKEITTPRPYEFIPEKLPYTIITPSSLNQDEDPLVSISEVLSDTISIDVIRGKMIHKILSSSINTQSFPSQPVLKRILSTNEGLPSYLTSQLANEILEEAKSILDDPFIKKLIDTSIECNSEWAIEDISNDHIHTGKVDLALFDGVSWSLIDFKTSRPRDNGAIEEFISSASERYQRQLKVYRSMLAHVKGIKEEKIRTFLCLTFLHKWIEIQ